MRLRLDQRAGSCRPHRLDRAFFRHTGRTAGPDTVGEQPRIAASRIEALHQLIELPVSSRRLRMERLVVELISHDGAIVSEARGQRVEHPVVLTLEVSADVVAPEMRGGSAEARLEEDA